MSYADKHKYYIEVDGKPQPCSLDEWGVMFGSPDKIVKRTTLKYCEISSIFMGFDHNYFDDGDPILYETMIFGDLFYEAQWRFCEREDQVRHHLLLVAYVSGVEALLSKRLSWRRLKPLLSQHEPFYLYEKWFNKDLKRLCYKTMAGKI